MGCGSSRSTSLIKSQNPPQVKILLADNGNSENVLQTENTKENIIDRKSKLPDTSKNNDIANRQIINSENGILVLYSESCKLFPRPSPPQHIEKVDIEYFFSPEMKAIYPGHDVVVRLDEHVEKAPLNLKENIESLVEYLVEVTTTDYEKARVVIRWIANNIAYDISFLKTGTYDGLLEAQDVLSSGASICEGYSNLVLEMCRICNLPCEKILGIAKGAGYSIGENVKNRKFRHAWNRIKISNTWFLCDATWASGYSKHTNGEYHYTSDWNEGYFLVPPETLRHSHKPNDDKFAMTDDQINDIEEWTNHARMYPSGCLFKISSVNPTYERGVIETKSNRVELTFRTIYPMTLRFTLVCASTGDTLKNRIACVRNGNGALLLVRLPCSGVYTVTLFGEPDCLSDRSKETRKGTLMSFKIKSTCESGSRQFPEFTHLLGANPAFVQGGFNSSIKFPIIEATEGNASFTIEKPGCELIKYTFRNENGKEINHFVFANTYPGKVIFNIRCPTKGEYSIIIFARFDKEHIIANRFETGATYLILSDLDSKSPLMPYLPITQWGPTDRLASHKIALNTSRGSEIVCDKDETIFEVGFNEYQTKVSYSLETEEGKTENIWIYADTTRRDDYVHLTVRFRIPVAGYYKFNLFAGKIGTKSNEFVGRWFVNVVNPYNGESFGFNKNVIWGPSTAKLLENELELLSINCSTISPDNDDCTLTIASTSKRRTGIVFSFKDSSNSKLNEYVLAESLQQNNEMVLYKFRYYPPKVGFYCFDLFGATGDYIGSWLIDMKESKKLDLPANDTRPWGPVQKFFDSGFSVIEPNSSTIFISSKTETTLTIASRSCAKIMGKLNFHRDKEDINNGFEIEYLNENNDNKKIVVMFNLIMKGYYTFKLFISNTGQGMYDYGGAWLLRCE